MSALPSPILPGAFPPTPHANLAGQTSSASTSAYFQNHDSRSAAQDDDPAALLSVSNLGIAAGAGAVGIVLGGALGFVTSLGLVVSDQLEKNALAQRHPVTVAAPTSTTVPSLTIPEKSSGSVFTEELSPVQREVGGGALPSALFVGATGAALLDHSIQPSAPIEPLPVEASGVLPAHTVSLSSPVT